MFKDSIAQKILIGALVVLASFSAGWIYAQTGGCTSAQGCGSLAILSNNAGNYVIPILATAFQAGTSNEIGNETLLLRWNVGGASPGVISATLSAASNGRTVSNTSGNASVPTLSVGINDTINYNWSSTGALSADSSYTVSPAYAPGDDCGTGLSGSGPFPWAAGATSGSTSGQTASCQAGRTYVITYTVYENADLTGASARASINVQVSIASVTTGAALSIAPAAMTLDASGATAPQGGDFTLSFSGVAVGLTGNTQSDITVDAGATVDYLWNSYNAESGRSIIQISDSNGSAVSSDSCQPANFSGTFSINGTDGGMPGAIVSPCQAGYTYEITYIAENTRNQSNGSTFRVAVRPPTASLVLEARRGGPSGPVITSGYSVGDYFTLTLTSNQPGADFYLCSTLTGNDGLPNPPGDQNHTGRCVPTPLRTNSQGGYAWSGTWADTDDGTWTEWIELSSNRLQRLGTRIFGVAVAPDPTASLALSVTRGGSPVPCCTYQSGDNYTLTLTTTNFQSRPFQLCSITNGITNPCTGTLTTNPSGGFAWTGTWNVSSRQDWTEWVTLLTSGGNIIARSNNLSFTINPVATPPTASFTANGSTNINVSPGAFVTYNWSSSGGTSYSFYLTVTGPSGQSCDPLNNCTGSTNFNPPSGGSTGGTISSSQSGYRYTFTYTVTGPGGTVQRSATVNVAATPPTASFTANGSTNINVSPGAFVTYNWSSSGGTSYSFYLTVTGPSGQSCDPLNNCTGSTNFNPPSGGSTGGTISSSQAGYRYTFTYTVTGPGGTVQRSATVNVASGASLPLNNPLASVMNTVSKPFADLRLSLASVARAAFISEVINLCSSGSCPMAPAQGTITWLSSDSSVASVDQSGRISAIAGGSATITVTFDPDGLTGPIAPMSASASVSITGALPPPPPPPPPPPSPTCSFSASPSTILRGQSSSLSWSCSLVTSCAINQGVGSVSTIGTRSVSPTQTMTYTLSCDGGVVTRTTIVTVLTTRIREVPP